MGQVIGWFLAVMMVAILGAVLIVEDCRDHGKFVFFGQTYICTPVEE